MPVNKEWLCTSSGRAHLWQVDVLGDVKHCPIFSLVFLYPLHAWRNLLSSSGIFHRGRYQPGCTGIFWPAEGTSQLVDLKKPTLRFTKEKGLSTGPSMIFDLFPRPTAFTHKSQITEASVLRPFSYTKMQQDVLQAEEKVRRVKDE